MTEDYERALEKIVDSHPILAAALRKAQQNRATHLEERASGVRLAGLNQWLAYLKALEAAFRATPALKPLAGLIARLCCDYEVAAEATLSGLHTVVFDSMRDVMETFMLLRDFRFDPSRIGQWLAASERELRNNFAPGVLRQRHADRLHVQTKDLAETADYSAHSRSLHISPKTLPWEKRGIVPKHDDPLLSDMCYWEIFSHANSIAVVVTELCSVVAPGQQIGPDLATDMPDVAMAYRQTSEMQQIFIQMIRANVKPEHQADDDEV